MVGQVQIAMQDYKSLCEMVVICANLVSTQTQTHRQLLTGRTISSPTELHTVHL